MLGFDYGEKRIGVAVGQSLTATAEPLETVANGPRGPDWARIAALVSTWQPSAVVVGLPLNMDGTEQAITRRARRFGRALGGRHGLTVHWADERLTTREAHERAAAGTDGRRRRARPRDDLAAQVILEGWLAQRASGELWEPPPAGETEES